MSDIRWKLESLPPRLREQAEAQLGIRTQQKPMTSETLSRIAKEFSSRIPATTRKRGGMYRAAKLSEKTEQGEILPNEGIAGVKSPGIYKFDKITNTRKTLTPDMAKDLVSSCEVSPDGNEVRFILDASPYAIPTFQQKKIAVIGGHPRLFKQAKVKKAEMTIMRAMKPHAHLFKDWGDAPRCVSIDFCYEYPSSTPKRDLIDYRYSTTKNDLDNSEKGLSDALTDAGFWGDDALIAELHLRKFRVLTKPRIVITIRKLSKTLHSAETDLFGNDSDPFFKDTAAEQLAAGKQSKIQN